MKNFFKKLFSWAYCKIMLYNNPYYLYGIPKDDYIIHEQFTTLKKLNLVICNTTCKSIIKGYTYALKIQYALDGKFKFEDKKLFLQFRDLVFQINSAEELFIIYEVFILGIYNYKCLNESVLIDIGMNVGVTTLFFAQYSYIKKIYAYELFKPTFLLGEQNFKLNQKYTHKITSFNYGVSNKAFQSELEYSFSQKGRMGLNGLPKAEQFDDIRKEEVNVKDINDVIEKVIDDNNNLDIIIKMDCEGEEFSLINRLAATGLLKEITILMIEWHYKDPSKIVNHLYKYDYHVFLQTLSSMNSGMIYACKRK